MKKVKYSIVITERIGEFGELLSHLSNLSENTLISALFSDTEAISTTEPDLIIVDRAESISSDELYKIENQKAKKIFIDKKLELSEIDMEYLQGVFKSCDIAIETPPKKSPKIYRELDSFKASITKEVRRAKRYHYPFVVVQLKLQDSSYSDSIIEYFSSKIREFDSLYIADENHFSMTLPHTGWNGAEILTSRLIREFTEKNSLDIASVTNIIKTFKRSFNDIEFIEYITSSEDSDYYPINCDNDFEVWRDEFFSEFAEGRVTRLYNSYKGMIISHDVDINLVDNSTIVVRNLRPIQLGALELEKVTYFESKSINKMIRAGVHNISDKGAIELSSFEVVDSSGFKNRSFNFIVEEEIPVTFENNSGRLFEISLNKLEILYNRCVQFEAGQFGSIELSLPTHRGEQNIKISGKVTAIESGESESIIELQIEAGEKETRLISEYLSKKQMQFTIELKKLSS
jgi:hypothetical protein